MPTQFSVTQHLGQITFSWTDESLCESGYALERTFANQVPRAFAQDFSHTDTDASHSRANTCGASIAPSAVQLSDSLGTADDLESHGLVGGIITYTLKAVSSIGVGSLGYASTGHAVEHTVCTSGADFIRHYTPPCLICWDRRVCHHISAFVLLASRRRC